MDRNNRIIRADSTIWISKLKNVYHILLIKTLLCNHDSRASDFGLMRIDNKGRILSFSEKPKGEELKAMVSLMFITL